MFHYHWKTPGCAKRKGGEPNPDVVGREGVVGYDALRRDRLSAAIDRICAGPAP